MAFSSGVHLQEDTPASLASLKLDRCIRNDSDYKTTIPYSLIYKYMHIGSLLQVSILQHYSAVYHYPNPSFIFLYHVIPVDL